jgi:hypothetical protein
MAIETTAAGIEAETVKPENNPKYAFAAPKTIESMAPMMIDLKVNSLSRVSGLMYGSSI